ncbi:MAG: hypothetical protein ACREUQ_13360, partial [Burkholderiales bacterium]
MATHSPPNSCNVLQVGSDRRRLWRFATGGGKAELSADLADKPNKPLPAKHVVKDWTALLESKLNIAWLPADQVFLRVIQLPKCDEAELRAMVELQLEKLSPLPVAQIVWSFEIIPQQGAAPTEEQTFVVVIVARQVVEHFLGQLEGKGYLADYLELPFLHQLRATQVDADGAWLFPQAEEGGRATCLIAWWYGGTLRQLGLAHLTAPGHWPQDIGEQLTKTAWAGELEG